MPTNKHSGETQVRMPGGRVLTLVFDWAAMAMMQAEWGNEFAGKVNDATRAGDMAVIAFAGACALARHHPKLASAEAVLELSPPLMPFLTALQRALALAYLGAEPAKAAAEGAPSRPLRRKRKAGKASPTK